MSGRKPDEIDLKILRMLRKDASVTASEISRQLHLSVQSINKRIAGLVSGGLISRYTIITDPAAVGKPVSAIISVVLNSADYVEGFLESVRRMENIVSCFAVTGDYDYILTAYASSVNALNDEIMAIKKIPGVSRTLTSFILQEYKQEFCVLPDINRNQK